MPNQSYTKGRAFEYEVANTFKALGCLTTRSAGSHGTWDLTIAAPNLTTINKVMDLFNSKPRRSVEGFLGTALDWSVGKTIYLTMIHGHYTNTLVVLIQCKCKTKAKK